MIRLVNSNRKDSLQLCRKDGFPAELFQIINTEPVKNWDLYQGSQFLGRAQYWQKERKGFLLIEHHDPEVETIREDISRILNKLIPACHPLWILSWTDNDAVRKAYSENLFYPKGRCLQRKIEPYRYLVSDGCFDEEGYIIHQGNMKRIPFGHYSTSERGCGWIAAYNLLKACGKEKTMQEVSSALGQAGWFGERFGQDMIGLRRYLIQSGLPLEATALGGRNVKKAMKQSRYGILLYRTAATSHFTMYRRISSDIFHFYNAVYGERNMNLSIEEFLKKHARSEWNTMLIWVKM